MFSSLKLRIVKTVRANVLVDLTQEKEVMTHLDIFQEGNVCPTWGKLIFDPIQPFQWNGWSPHITLSKHITQSINFSVDIILKYPNIKTDLSGWIGSA